MNTISVIQSRRNGVVYYQSQIRVNGKFLAFSSMSEAGARSWLAQQGIPFTKQPELTTKGGN